MVIASFYHSIIEWITGATGMDDASLHFHAGLVILFSTRLLSRRSLDTMVPLAAVIVAELANECLDRAYWGGWRWDDTAADVVHTLLWPVLISLGAWARSTWPDIVNRTRTEKVDRKT